MTLFSLLYGMVFFTNAKYGSQKMNYNANCTKTIAKK